MHSPSRILPPPRPQHKNPSSPSSLGILTIARTQPKEPWKKIKLYSSYYVIPKSWSRWSLSVESNTLPKQAGNNVSPQKWMVGRWSFFFLMVPLFLRLPPTLAALSRCFLRTPWRGIRAGESDEFHKTCFGKPKISPFGRLENSSDHFFLGCSLEASFQFVKSGAFTFIPFRKNSESRNVG